MLKLGNYELNKFRDVYLLLKTVANSMLRTTCLVNNMLAIELRNGVCHLNKFIIVLLTNLTRLSNGC
jgi:hypothetical protein